MQDPARHAKRASWLMFLMGGLMLLVSGCLGIVASVPPSQYDAQMQQVIADLERQVQAESGQAVPAKLFLAVLAGMFGIPALILILLGFIVRRGTKVPVILSLIVAGLLTLLLVIQVLSAATQVAQDPRSIVGVALILVLAGMAVWMLVELIRALRSADEVARSRNQQYGYGMPYPQYNPYAQQQHPHHQQQQWHPPPPPPQG